MTELGDAAKVDDRLHWKVPLIEAVPLSESQVLLPGSSNVLPSSGVSRLMADKDMLNVEDVSAADNVSIMEEVSKDEVTPGIEVVSKVTNTTSAEDMPISRASLLVADDRGSVCVGDRLSLLLSFAELLLRIGVPLLSIGAELGSTGLLLSRGTALLIPDGDS